MNEDLLTPEDQVLLDRLVDGELTESERQELLFRLERSPDGWRRCALAFLEAQAWRGEARSLFTESQQPAATGTASTAAKEAMQPASRAGMNGTRANRPGLSVWLPLATAAGFLLAVGYVKWFDAGLGRVPGGQPGQIAASSTTSGGGMFPANVGQSRPQVAAAHDLQMVVSPGQGSEPRVVEVPLVESERMNEALFGPWAQQLPPEVVRMLEQNGNQVVRERGLMPIDLQGRRRVVVPMDQLDIHPAGLRSFH